jgi:hypothetical protein
MPGRCPSQAARLSPFESVSASVATYQRSESSKVATRIAQECADLEPLRIICPPRSTGCDECSEDEHRSEKHGGAQRRVGSLSATRADLPNTRATAAVRREVPQPHFVVHRKNRGPGLGGSARRFLDHIWVKRQSHVMGLAHMRRWSRRVVAALLFASVCGLSHVSLDDTDCVIPVAAAYQPGVQRSLPSVRPLRRPLRSAVIALSVTGIVQRVRSVLRS